MTAARRPPLTIAVTAATLVLGLALSSASSTRAEAQTKPSSRAATGVAKPSSSGKKATPDSPPPTQPLAPQTKTRDDRTTPPTTEPSQTPASRKLPPLPPVDTSTPPPLLPRASRERMRACAEEWEKMKRATKTTLPMWREFATGCLTR